ncbi:MAG: hypothetical protein ACYS9T_11485 [Planctomycetota bacterium]|jgi:hypothetical protein
MKLEKRQRSGREKDDAAVEVLSQLRQRLYSDDISTARRAAFNLSWMQEDGLDILKEALFGNFPRTAKKAAAYGLRRMHGRMRRMASEVLKEGLKHRDRTIRETCQKGLLLMQGKTFEKVRPRRKPKSGRFRIKDLPSGSRAKFTRKRINYNR